MAFKKIENYITFADLAIEQHGKKNRTFLFLKQLNNTIDWNPVNELLLQHYPVGKSSEGGDAYPPLMLFKCLLLQKWFQIHSDPELESQINDRFSFKNFLGIPLEHPAPDHSTFSRFRNRVTKDTMIQANSILLQQLHGQGISINKGVAVDARLVKSASSPLSGEKLEEVRKHQNSPEGKLDKKGNPKKFSRDCESDWTVKNDKPHFGIKEHAAVDTDNGLILSVNITPASHHDSRYLPHAVTYSMHTDEKVEIVYADKGYFGEPNRFFLSLNEISDGIMRKDTTTAKLTEVEIERNKGISKYRYIVRVEAPVTRRSPHRSVRAEFPHTVPRF